MESSLLPRIIIFIILMCVSAFFSASEVALFSLRRSRIDHLKTQGLSIAQTISDLLARPRRLIITILIGNETVNLAAAAIVASLVITLAGDGYKWLAILIMTPILMIFGEITPKSIALRRPERVSRWVGRPLAAFAVAATPLRWIFRNASEWIIRILSGGRQTADNILSEDEFRTWVDMGHEVGELEEQERKLIHNVFEFSDTLVSEIMVPRPDIFLLSYQMEIPRILQAIRKNPHSRIPVYRSHPGNVAGILHTKDLLPLVRGSMTPKAGTPLPLREPFFIPPSKKVSDLFHDFKQLKTHIALVVDEFGDLDGLVTLEDVLEELFEAISDPPGDNGMKAFETLKAGSHLVSGRMTMRDVEEKLGFALPDSPADTLGGLVMDLFGRVPETNEQIGRNGLLFTVTEMHGRRILKVRIDIPESWESPA